MGCAQVARYTLLEFADQVAAGINANRRSAEISRRQRAMLKAATEYHFDHRDVQPGSASLHQRALFQGLLQEQALTGLELAAAAAADQAAPG